MHECWVALLAACLLVSASSVYAAHVETLPNGCTLAVEENHSAPVAAVRFYVKVGSVYEGEYIGAGISHFIEHCVSEGTPTRTKEQIDNKKESLGNDSNAYTSADVTCYYINTAGDYVLDAADLISDYVFHANFPVENVKTQRGIILREIARGDDDPGRRIWNMLAQTTFTTHPARYRVIGYEDQFTSLTRADLAAFHSAAYTPENTIAVVVGDFDMDEVLPRLRDMLSKEPSRATRLLPLPTEADQIAPRRRVEIDNSLNRAQLFIGWRTVDLFQPDLYALDVAAYILGHGRSSRLTRTLRDELGLVDGIGAMSYTPRYDAGIFGINAVLDPVNVAEAEKAVAAEVERLKTADIDPEELQRVLAQKSAEVIYGQETIEGRASVLGSDLLSTGDPGFSDLYVANIKKVTAEDVRRVANKYLVAEKQNTAILGPEAVASQADMTHASAGGAGKIVRKQLDNGLTVIVQEAHHSPTVSMLAGVKAGVLYETPRDNGICNLTANMLTRGTTSRTYEQIADQTDAMAASIAPFSGRNTYGLQAQCTSDTFDKVLDIFADCIMHPAFPEDQLAKQRQLTLAAIQGRDDNVDAVTSDLLSAAIYGKYPYGMPLTGTLETVQSLTREQVASFHDRYSRPNGMVVAILGDVDADKAIRAIEDRFADFEIGEITPPEIAAAPAKGASEPKIVEREQQQAIIMYGFLGPTIGSEDRYARDVMTAILAGMPIPGGRLHEALRGAELVYATFAYAMPGIDTGHYTLYAATAPEKVAQARATIEQTVLQFVAEGPSAEELERGKSMATSAKQLSIQSNLDRAQTIVLDELYGQGFDNYQHYAENINAVTAEEIKETAKEMLDFGNATLVITQPAQQQ